MTEPSENINPKLTQSNGLLQCAGDGTQGQPTSAPKAARLNQLAQHATHTEINAKKSPPAKTCENRLKLTFYFDGTGNNLDADRDAQKHSNVARLFLCRTLDDPAESIYSYYVPGLGTYFREIGDTGGTAGLAFGAKGQDRLDWAFQQLDKRVRAANKLIGLDIAVFGFSRGAALARAFACQLQERCMASAGGWVLKGSKATVEIYFLGLWDTVASVGMPKSANNEDLGTIAGAALGARPLILMQNRYVEAIAYGKPGADPAPPSGFTAANGHMAWGAQMVIPPIVTRGAHMIAGHEIRNSFPVDSTMQNDEYPQAFAGQEWVFPGAHSDVGGGYRAGEGARSLRPGQALSMITLRRMYELARTAGVPIQSFEALLDARIRKDFAIHIDGDPDSNAAAAKDYAETLDLWNHYQAQLPKGSLTVGGWMLAHMKLYYRWRFWNIRSNQVARKVDGKTDDDKTLAAEEPGWAAESKALDAQIEKADKSASVQQARSALSQANEDLYAANESGSQEEQVAALSKVNAAKAQLSVAEDPLNKLKAKKAALPSTGKLSRNLSDYDQRLYDDAKLLSENTAMRAHLRPHYSALVEAYEDEFLNNKGLIDVRIMKFFEHYVHDSLAGFASDATLPSDPRVVYIGGNEMEQYAKTDTPVAQTAAVDA